MMNGDGMASMGLMWFFGLLVLVGVVVLVRVLSGRSRDSGGTRTGVAAGREREILEERYARGEISTEEYRGRLRLLQEDGRQAPLPHRWLPTLPLGAAAGAGPDSWPVDLLALRDSRLDIALWGKVDSDFSRAVIASRRRGTSRVAPC